MHCVPNILSKIGIDVQNRQLCDLLQGQILDFDWGARCMLIHLRCALGTLHSQQIDTVNAVTVHGYKIEVLHNQLAFELSISEN